MELWRTAPEGDKRVATEKFLKSLFRATGAKTEAELQRRFRRLERSTVNRRLRSCCLELRADDSRLRFDGGRQSAIALAKADDPPSSAARRTTAGKRAMAKRLRLKITAELVRKVHERIATQ